jgi:hypothetical protein
MVDVPTIVQFNALATRVANLEALAGSLGSRVVVLENNATKTPTPAATLSPAPAVALTPTGLLPRPTFQTVTPTRNADFLAIWGVNGNIAGNAPVYRDAAGVASDVAYLGARFYRESLASTQSFQLAVLKAIVGAGVRLIAHPPAIIGAGEALVVGGIQSPSIIGSATPLVIATLLAVVKAWANLGTDSVSMVEGPDNPYAAAISYSGVNGGGRNGSWTSVADFQRDWYAAIKGDIATSSISVSTPTVVGKETPNVGLQYVTIPAGAGATFVDGTIFADLLAMQLYPGVDWASPQTVDETGDHILDQLTSDFVTTVRGSYAGYTVAQAMTLGRTVSEFGISTLSGTVKVNEDVKGKNLLTGILNLRRTAYQAVCLNELYESGDGFGLFSAKNVPNLSATYLHNAAVVLNDPGVGAATFSPASIMLGISTIPTTAIWDLFQKADAHYQFVIWNNTSNWSGSDPVSIPAQSVTVTWPALGTVSIYDPTIAATAVGVTRNASSATVSLTDHPLIVDWVQTSV